MQFCLCQINATEIQFPVIIVPLAANEIQEDKSDLSIVRSFFPVLIPDRYKFLIGQILRHIVLYIIIWIVEKCFFLFAAERFGKARTYKKRSESIAEVLVHQRTGIINNVFIFIFFFTDYLPLEKSGIVKKDFCILCRFRLLKQVFFMVWVKLLTDIQDLAAQHVLMGSKINQRLAD